MSRELELEDGNSIALDQYGHLVRRADWNRRVAIKLAEADGIELESGHWQVIRIFQDYFDEAGIEPPMRVLFGRLKEQGAEGIASSLEMYRLFPEGPVRQASRYGGLPIPVSCI